MTYPRRYERARLDAQNREAKSMTVGEYSAEIDEIEKLVETHPDGEEAKEWHTWAVVLHGMLTTAVKSGTLPRDEAFALMNRLINIVFVIDTDAKEGTAHG